jgi:hypothetical protein
VWARDGGLKQKLSGHSFPELPTDIYYGTRTNPVNTSRETVKETSSKVKQKVLEGKLYI